MVPLWDHFGIALEMPRIALECLRTLFGMALGIPLAAHWVTSLPIFLALCSLILFAAGEQDGGLEDLRIILAGSAFW